jgi:tetratricopeptide (TPR) repeat protein
MEYYQGLAALKLGQNAKAQQLFDNLIARGQKMLAGNSESGFFAKFGSGQSERHRMADAHYLIGLGNLGKGTSEKAREEFQQALKVDINHLGATAQLMAMSGTNTRASR